MGEVTALPYNRIPIKNIEGMREIEKSPLGKHLSNNYCSKKSLTDPKISGQKHEKQVSKRLPKI